MSEERPKADDLRAKVFRDRIIRVNRRVEKMDRDAATKP